VARRKTKEDKTEIRRPLNNPKGTNHGTIPRAENRRTLAPLIEPHNGSLVEKAPGFANDATTWETAPMRHDEDRIMRVNRYFESARSVDGFLRL